MTLWTIKADAIAEDDGSANRTIRIVFDQDSGAGIAITENTGSGKFQITPMGSASNLDIEFTAKGSGMTRSGGSRVLTTVDSTSFDAAGSSAAVSSTLSSHTASTTAHGITAAAATVLDDTTVAAMVDTLGGAAATGTGGLVRATSPTLVTPALGTPASGTLTNCTGLPASGLSGGTLSLLFAPVRRVFRWFHDNGATTVTTVGASTGVSTIGTGTVSSVDTTSGAWEQLLTGTTIGNVCGRSSSSTVTQRSWNPIWCKRYLTGASISNLRFWLGFSDSDLSGVSGSPTTQHVAAFRYDTAVDGTAFWRCVTCDGSAATVTTSSVAISNSTAYDLAIAVDDSVPSVSFYVNGTLAATHTTNLPGQTTQLKWWSLVTTLAAAAKRIAWNCVALETK